MSDKSKKAFFESSKYDYLRLLYYRTRLRISNTFDSLRLRLRLPSESEHSENVSCLRTANDSKSETESEVGEDYEDDFPESELPISSEARDLFSSDNNDTALKNENAVFDKKGKTRCSRRRRSSRTRGTESDVPYEPEPLTGKRSGTGDQPDYYDYMENESDSNKSLIDVAENQSTKQFTSKEAKKSTEEALKSESYFRIPQRTQPPLKQLKMKRKLPSSYADSIALSKREEQETRRINNEIKPQPTVSKKSGVASHSERPPIIKDAHKKNVSPQTKNKSSFLMSHISSIGQPRGHKAADQKRVHMAIGMKFIRSGYVRNRTCGQEFRKLLGIPQKERNMSKGAPKSSNDTSHANKNVPNKLPEEKQNNVTSVHHPEKYNTLKSLRNIEQGKQHQRFVSYSPPYTPTMCGHTNLNDYGRVTTMSGFNTPTTPFTRHL